MKLESKFDVNNLVKFKFDNLGEKRFSLLEILEVSSVTCYAGTQYFYICRSIIAEREYNNKWVIAHSIGTGDNKNAYRKYREDELINADEKEINIILNKGDDNKEME